MSAPHYVLKRKSAPDDCVYYAPHLGWCHWRINAARFDTAARARGWRAVLGMTAETCAVVRVTRKAAIGDDFDAGPYVCPGCYAVGGERCAPGCIDAEIERQREEDDDEDVAGSGGAG